MAAGKERATLQGHTDIVFSVAFSPDGKTLAAGSGGIKLWDAATGQERATFPGPKFLSVAFSPDGKTLAAGGSDGTIKVWDMQTAKEQTTLQGPTQSVDAVAFSPDGKTLVSGSEDKTLRLWDLATGKEQTSLQGQLVPVSLAFSPDGKTLAVGRVYEKAIELWDVTPGNAADNPSGVAAVQPPPAPVAPPSHSSLDNTPSPPTSPSPPERKEGPRPVDPRVAPLLRQLNSPQTQDKVAALKGLGDLGPDVREVAGMAVASALLNRFPTVQNAAKDALTRIDPEVAPLCNAILFQTDQDSHVKSLQAIQALGRKGRSATPILIWVVKNRADTTETPTDSEATFAVRALTDVANDQAILPDLYLSWLHNSPDFRVRTGAAGGLPKLDKVKNINQVITALSLAARTDKAQSVRYWAASALGDFGASARAAEGTLQQIMASDPDAQVREVAEKSLRKIQESSRSPNPEIPGASPSGPGASGVPSTTPTPSSGGGNPTSEQEALDQVKALGATIEGGGGRPVFVTVNAKALTDADLGRLEADLKAMPNLKKLVLQGQTVTDAWLPHVKELTKLEELGLIDTAVTDAGVKNLTGLTNLNLLSLYGTPVTDASIPTLSQLKGLKQVFLSRTKVTDPGAAELQKALPEALILHSGG